MVRVGKNNANRFVRSFLAKKGIDYQNLSKILLVHLHRPSSYFCGNQLNNDHSSTADRHFLEFREHKAELSTKISTSNFLYDHYAFSILTSQWYMFTLLEFREFVKLW